MLPLSINVTLAVLVAASVATDIKLRKIHNVVTMPAILSGLILNSLNNGASGALFSLYGILLATGMMALPFIMKGIGGGDLKMLAAIGALKGPEFVFVVFVSGGIAGGIIAAMFLNTKAKRKASINQIKNMCLTVGQGSASATRMQEQDSPKAIPYAVAIAAGTVVAILVAPLSLF